MENSGPSVPVSATLRSVTDTRLAVRLNDLEVTLGRLRALERHLGSTEGELRHAATASGLGDVEVGVDGFARHWHHGLNVLHDGVQQLYDALVVVHTGYAEHEALLARQLSSP